MQIILSDVHAGLYGSGGNKPYATDFLSPSKFASLISTRPTFEIPSNTFPLILMKSRFMDLGVLFSAKYGAILLVWHLIICCLVVTDAIQRKVEHLDCSNIFHVSDLI